MKAKGAKADISPAASRIEMSPSTLHSPSIQDSSEEEVEGDEDENEEQEGSGDFVKKKEEKKVMPS